jgi:hypothetical protein
MDSSVELTKKLTAREVLDQMRDAKIVDDEAYNNWLLYLHKHHTDRMLSDNGRIWQTSAIFVPVALAAFAALTAIKSPLSWWHVAILGLPSTSIVWLWLVIAENHRGFQKKSEAWLFAIEESRGLFARHAPLKFPSKGYDRLVTFDKAIQKSRWWLVFGVGTFWIVLLVLVSAGVIR